MKEKKRWVNLFKTTNRIEAHQILSLLESNGIKTVPLDKIEPLDGSDENVVNKINAYFEDYFTN